MNKKSKKAKESSAEIEKEKARKSITAKYKKIFKNVEKDKKTFVEKLCKEAVFMELTLMELQKKIEEDGAVIETTNGNGFKVKQENPATKSYNTMIRNYNGIMKTLVEQVPEGAEADELMLFLGNGKGKQK